jgi:hypothetical protein
MVMSPRRLVVAAAVLATVGGIALASPAAGRRPEPSPVLETGIVGSEPTDTPIVLAAPGGRPWVASRLSRIEVSRSGRLEAEVRGLVIPTAPFNGTNPVPGLSATLYCTGALVGTSATVPFSPAGNAVIEARFTLPDRCLAPLVLLNPNGATATFIGVSGA